MYWAPTVCEHWRQSSEQKAHKALCSPCPYDSELALQGADIHPLQNSPSAANPHYLEQDSTNAQINMVPGAHYTEKPVWKFLEKIKQMGTNTFWKIMQKIDVMSSKAEQSKTLRQWPWTCRHSLSMKDVWDSNGSNWASALIEHIIKNSPLPSSLFFSRRSNLAKVKNKTATQSWSIAHQKSLCPRNEWQTTARFN